VAKKDTTKKETVPVAEAAKLAQGNGFIKDTQEELTKVVWPSRQQLISESAAVILMVAIVSLIIYWVDHLFAWGAGKVFG
jgi:preprotein translocase subunit SecE